MTTSTKFKLNTQLKSTSRVRGWSSTCDLDVTMKSVMNHQEQIPALKAAIKLELVEGEAKLAIETVAINSPRAARGTRTSNNIAARYERAYAKVQALTRALTTLEAI